MEQEIMVGHTPALGPVYDSAGRLMAAVGPLLRVNPWTLQGGEILVSEGIEYRVLPGFRESQSSCWRDSRWIEVVQLTGHPARVGQCTWVNPSRAAIAKATGSAA